MSANENGVMRNLQPVVAEGNLVPNFDPLKLLVSTPDGPKLALPYKKLWFHKKHLNGRIKLSPLRITDQLAIIEASVFFDRGDPEPATSYIVEKKKDDVPLGRYIEAAQDAAIEQALSNAGFDVQFVPVRQPIGSTENAPQTKQPVEPITKPASVMETIPQTDATPTCEIRSDAPAISAEAKKQVIAEEPPQQAANPVPPLSVVQDTVNNPPQASLQQAAHPMDDFEEILLDDATQDPPAAPAYTSDMPVDTILSLMTLEEARSYVVKEGACNGWTLAKVEARRPASLKFYVNGYSGRDNILRAGAKLLLSDTQEKAS